jgi:hypothetical protein
MEFSKKIVIGAATATLIMIIVTLELLILGYDVTETGAITALCFALLDLSIGFYFWKAKNENRIKLTKSMVKEWADAYGIESVAALAEIVLKE